MEAFRFHQRRVWGSLSHKSLFDNWKYSDPCVWCGNEVHIHKSMRDQSYEASCIACGWLYDEYVPDKEEVATYILLEGRGRWPIWKK